ncbi:MAG: hypothetical protein Fur0037_15360 [Planctomycetota bacterium]
MNRIPARSLLLLGSTALALAAGEVLFRAFEPPTRPGKVVLYAANGQRLPGGEIAYFAARKAEYEQNVNLEIEAPHGLLQANFHQSMAYEDPKPRWDYFDEHGGVAIDTNSLGFRDLEFPAEKRPGEFRALAIGDSFTFGQGVRLDLTWPQVLERDLRALRGEPVEVINAGFACGPGITTPDGYDRWLEAQGIRLDPDLVIVGLCLNDLGYDVPMLSYEQVPSTPVLGGFSHLLDYLVWTWKVRTEPRNRLDVCRSLREHPEQWRGTQRGLLAMRDLLAARGIPFVVAVFPMLSELGPDYPYQPLHDEVERFCRANGILRVDLRHAFDGYREEDLWVHFCDQHPNHVGHAIMAGAILAFLDEKGLVPAR